ncbi:hypothetical protein B0I08_108166 [Glaciihabitans tibetensis]|uniref:Uncharacterized protein n=1 Tax=Glaciihabitans tibetensis TaxID=1266600 RepID=A0A2T0VAI3_9MICO|nr:hypothetical protein B0I08_108166 [Glaciihabitans tibetensis]
MPKKRILVIGVIVLLAVGALTTLVLLAYGASSS